MATIIANFILHNYDDDSKSIIYYHNLHYHCHHYHSKNKNFLGSIGKMMAQACETWLSLNSYLFHLDIL